jgi:integrase
MKLTKRGAVYSVHYSDPITGKRKRVSTGETDEAAAYIKAGAIVQGAANVAATTPSGSTSRLLGDALEATFIGHWSRTKSAKVMRRVVNLLKRELADLPLTDVTTKTMRVHCERWLTEGSAPATVNRRMSAVGVTLTRAVEEGDLVARPKLPHYAEDNVKERYVTVDEERAILVQLDQRDTQDTTYIRNLAVFLLDTGFRFSEAFAFQLDGDHAHLLHGTTKTGTGRRVPLTKRARAAAENMLTSSTHTRLLTMKGKQSWDYVSHRFAAATKAVGCPDVTLHILRHTCASRLVQRGVPIYTVSKWLGHSSVSVTERYAKLAPNSLSDALVALEAAA